MVPVGTWRIEGEMRHTVKNIFASSIDFEKFVSEGSVCSFLL